MFRTVWDLWKPMLLCFNESITLAAAQSPLRGSIELHLATDTYWPLLPDMSHHHPHLMARPCQKHATFDPTQQTIRNLSHPNLDYISISSLNISLTLIQWLFHVSDTYLNWKYCTIKGHIWEVCDVISTYIALKNSLHMPWQFNTTIENGRS